MRGALKTGQLKIKMVGGWQRLSGTFTLFHLKSHLSVLIAFVLRSNVSEWISFFFHCMLKKCAIFLETAGGSH